MNEFNIMANVLSVFPYMEKDKNGNKTQAVKGYILKVAEIKKNDEGFLVANCNDFFPDVNMLSVDSAKKLDFMAVVELTLEISNAFGKPRLVAVRVVDEKSLSVFPTYSFSFGKAV